MLRGHEAKKYAESLGYQFCEEIRVASELIQPAVNDKAHESLREDSLVLARLHDQLEAAMCVEEEKRDGLNLPASLWLGVDAKNFESKRQEFTTRLSDLSKKAEANQAKKTELTRRQPELKQLIEAEFKNEQAQTIANQKKYADELKACSDAGRALEQQQRLKEQAIDSRTCGCISSSAKQDRGELIIVKVKIANNRQRLSDLKSNPPKAVDDATRIKLQNEQAGLAEQFKKLETEGIDLPQDTAKLQKELGDLVAQYAKNKADYDSKTEKHYSSISKESMIMYVRVYACFMNLKKGIGYSDNIEDQLKDKLREAQDKIDFIFNKLRCPGFSNITAREVFEKGVRQLADDNISLFLSGKINADIEKTLFPPAQGSLQIATGVSSPMLLAKNTVPASAPVEMDTFSRMKLWISRNVG